MARNVMVDDIVMTFKKLNKKNLTNKEIYNEVRKIKENRRETIANDYNFRAYVRYSLLVNQVGKGRGCFKKIGQGVWTYIG